MTPAASGLAPGAGLADTPRFATGSLLRHVVVMAGTGAIGLIAVFAVDLLNLFYLSVLKSAAVTAALGFAGAIGFFHISICIGLTIGISAVVSRHIGAGEAEKARKVATASLTWMAGIAILLGLLTALFAEQFADLLGAKGQARELAVQFLEVTSPSWPFLAVGMASAALLRSIGDAKRAMNVTLVAAFATALLDPLFIFGLHLGLLGGAISTLLSRIFMAGLGWYAISRAHKLLAKPGEVAWLADTAAVRPIAASAVATNLATPVGAAFVTHAMSGFGSLAVSGQITIDRITPVAFGLIYALTGAVGPILAQNRGAKRLDRVHDTLRAALIFMLVSVLVAWLVLALAQNFLVALFHAEGDMALILHFFCTYLAGGFFFVGCLFVANSSFNNLGHPLLATLFNWGRATLGTIPLVLLGAHFGPLGVISAQTLGSLVFGVLALVIAFRLAARPPS